MPRDHPLGSKRLCVDTGYFETFNRPNVRLVDLRDEPLLAVEPEGVRTERALYPLDALILATGFDAMTGALRRIDPRGRGGRRLSEKWNASGPPRCSASPWPAFPTCLSSPARAARRCSATWSRRPNRMSTGSPIAWTICAPTVLPRSRRSRRPRTPGSGRSPPRRRAPSCRRASPGMSAPTSPASRGSTCPIWAACRPISTRAGRRRRTATARSP